MSLSAIRLPKSGRTAYHQLQTFTATAPPNEWMNVQGRAGDLADDGDWRESLKEGAKRTRYTPNHRSGETSSAQLSRNREA